MTERKMDGIDQFGCVMAGVLVGLFVGLSGAGVGYGMIGEWAGYAGFGIGLFSTIVFAARKARLLP